MEFYNRKFIALGFLAFVAVYNLPYLGLGLEQSKANLLAIIAMMLTWWIGSALPLAVTALVPVIAFPLLDISPHKEVMALYSHPIIFLFLAGFLLALAIEKTSLHKRLALNIIQYTGTNPKRIILGFMISTAFLSMWVSNTATTLMMLPIGLSVLSTLFEGQKIEKLSKSEAAFAIRLMLAIAFAANIGGISTLIGTPPNAILAGFLERTTGQSISFFTWFLIAFPQAMIMLLFSWWLFCLRLPNEGFSNFNKVKEQISNQLNKLGKISQNEKIVLAVLGVVVFFWAFKKVFFNSAPHDSIIGIIGAVLLFILGTKGKPVLYWKDTTKLAWGILLLFGGGLNIATSLGQAGIVEDIVSQLEALSGLNIYIIIALVAAVTLILTEAMSNLALTAVILPFIFALASNIGHEPLQFLIPATIAASFAFTMPISTPPNSIVFASGYLKVKDMIKFGIILNLFGLIIVTFVGKNMLWLLNIHL